MKTQQHSIWDTALDGDRTKSKNDEDERKRYRLKKCNILQRCCCRCSCSTPILTGFLLGVLTTGIALAVLLSIYLAGKATNHSINLTSEDTSTSVSATGIISISTSSESTTIIATISTTSVFCGATCIDTTASTVPLLAFYSFDDIIIDATGIYPLSSTVSPTYVSGWVGSAVSFTYSNARLLSTSHIPLNSRSFTVDFWFYATDLSSNPTYGFAGEKQSASTNLCLLLGIRNKRLYFQFYNNDVSGNIIISTNTWYHVAFVYDYMASYKYIYLNGVLDASSSSASLLATTGSFTIGGAYIGGGTSTIAYYSGYIDHFTISSGAKSACEIYLDAVLACYFTFDSASSIDDSGPNFLTATNNGATSTTGRFNQALQFSSALSYVTISGISALTSSNTAFTISMWVNPTSVSGGATLIHTSTQSNGQDNCLVLWGLTSAGTMSVNVIDSSNTTIPATASSALPLNTWTHIAQTFSTTNGNYLYINGTLVASTSSATGRSIGPYVFLGASPTGTSYCETGLVVMGQFYGSIDEYRVFGREISSIDICRLANP